MVNPYFYTYHQQGFRASIRLQYHLPALSCFIIIDSLLMFLICLTMSSSSSTLPSSFSKKTMCWLMVVSPALCSPLGTLETYPNLGQFLRSFTWGLQGKILLITFTFLVSMMLSLSSRLTTSSKVSIASLFTNAIKLIQTIPPQSTQLQSITQSNTPNNTHIPRAVFGPLFIRVYNTKSKMNKDILLDQNQDFKQSGLNSYLIRCYQRLSFQRPTPIQFHSIHTFCSTQRSIVAQSKSGTGKTLSYISVILTHIISESALDNTCKYLILLPTRELTLQVYQNFKEIFNAFSSVKALSEEEVAVRQRIKRIRLLMTIGGIPFEDDRKKYLQEGGNIIIGTIGRVLEFVDKRLIKLNELRMLVLDEGDKLFENRNKKLSDVLAQVLTQKEEQQYKTIFLVYSATYTAKLLKEITNKRQYTFIQTLFGHNGKMNVNITQDPQKIVFDPSAESDPNPQSSINLQNIKKFKLIPPNLDNSYFNSKIKLLLQLLETLSYQRCLVFVEKKTLLEQINERLIAANLQTLLIHGSLSQSSRIKLMNQINKSKIVVASDLLARGIDIQLDLVVLFDARQNDTFWHRIGRTGRYDKMGVAISLDDVEGWEVYSHGVVQGYLDQIGMTFNKGKEWYGKFLTEIGNWNQTNVEKEIQQSRSYKYFNQLPLVQVVSEPQVPQSQQSLKKPQHSLEHSLSLLQRIQSQQQLRAFLQAYSSCSKCQCFLSQVSDLTGYRFQLLSFLNP